MGGNSGDLQPHILSDFEAQAVRLYAETGNFEEVARQLSCTVYSLRKMEKEEWWELEVQEIRRCQNAMLDVRLTKLIDKSLSNMEDLLENGEEYYDALGNLHMKAVPSHTIHRFFTELFDRRQVLRQLPTSITQASNEGKMKELAEKLEQLARYQEARTIEAEPSGKPAQQAQRLTRE